jgi:hypothetical protein
MRNINKIKKLYFDVHFNDNIKSLATVQTVQPCHPPFLSGFAAVSDHPKAGELLRHFDLPYGMVPNRIPMSLRS